MAITISEFEDRCYNDIYELREFCDENGITVMEDVYDCDQFNDMMDERIRDATHNAWWDEVRDWLNSIPGNKGDYNWYYEESGDWYGTNSDDTSLWYDDVLEVAVFNGYVIGDVDEEEFESDSSQRVYKVQNDDEVNEDFMSILNLEVA